MTVVLQRAAARFVTIGDGWVGRYCFSYDEHYDPAHISFGRMLACNEFLLEPGRGFGPHRHGGIDVVTTVLSGTLTHVHGGVAEARPPGSYVFATGAGAEHDERNDGDVPVRFVQAWIRPGTADPRPSEARSGSTALAPRSFLLVVDGAAALDGTPLEPGDSARVDGPAALTVEAAARVLVWSV
jgi:mannose-6-phosphate isomerase-like protein (cupin superfamily)